APGARLRPYRVSNNTGALVAALAGFMRAKSDHPAILTNAWGGDGPFPPPGPPEPSEGAWGLEIRDAVEQGSFGVSSAGNGQFSIDPGARGAPPAGGPSPPAVPAPPAPAYPSGSEPPGSAGVLAPDVGALGGRRPRPNYTIPPAPAGSPTDVQLSQPRL